MLQSIRDNIQGTAAKIIIAIIVVPFAFFGVESLIGSGRQIVVAEVNGQDIPEADLQRVIEMQKRRLMSMMGDRLDPRMLEDATLRQPALQSLIDKTVLLQAADDYGVDVPDTALDRYITSMPEFQEAGQFSPQKYQSLLRSNGLNPATFKSSLGDDLVVQQLNNGFGGSAFVTDADLNQAAKIIAEQRSFRYLTISRENADDMQTSEVAIEAYYEKHIDQFQLPERVKLAYIDIHQNKFYPEIDEARIRSAYEQEIASFTAQAERRVSHILLEINDKRSHDQAVTELKGFEEKIKTGASFSELAKKYSDDFGSADNGGDLGYTGGNTFPPAFESKLASLSVGQMAIVETDAGVHLIELTEEKGSQPPSYDERKIAIKQFLQDQASKAEFVAKIEELRDRVFNEDSLKVPAEALDLNVGESGWLVRGSSEGLFEYPAVQAAAFSNSVLNDKHNSEVIELANDHYVVVRVIAHDTARPSELVDVRGEIEAQIKADMAAAATLEKGQSLLVKVEAGESIEALAKANKLQWQVEQNAKRSSAVDRALLKKVFSLADAGESGEQASSGLVQIQNGDVIVVRLVSVTPGSLNNMSPAEQQAVAAQMYRQDVSRSIQEYASRLRDRSKVKVL